MKWKSAVVILPSSPESPFAPQTAPASINITEKPMKVCDNGSLMQAFRLQLPNFPYLTTQVIQFVLFHTSAHEV